MALPGTYRPALLLLLLVGAGLEALLWTRGWIYGDQTKLLSLGWQLAATGELLPTSGQLAAGLRSPGSLLQILVGLPLRVWPDFRAPVLLAQILHLAAVALLVRTLGRALGWRLALIFLVTYWYSPWFMYQAGFLWEPSFVLLPAALNLWACHRLRAEAAWLPSAVLTAALVAAIQIHPSALIPALATAILLARRKIRLNWLAGAAGGAAGAITLAPFLVELLSGRLAWSPWPGAAADPRPLASGLKGLVYWFRLGSADLGRRFRETTYCSDASADASPGEAALCAVLTVVIVLAVASVLVPVAANGWYYRSRTSGDGTAEDTAGGAAGWLRSYVGSFFVATIVASALSPALVQGWDLVITLHAACLPVAVWFDAGWTAPGGWRRRLLSALVLLRIAGVLLVAFGHPMYLVPAPEIQEHVVLEHLQPLVLGEAPGAEP